MNKDGNWLHLVPQANGHFLCCQNQQEVPLAALLIFADELEFGNIRRVKRTVTNNECVYGFDKPKNQIVEMQYDESKESMEIKAGNGEGLSFLSEEKSIFKSSTDGSCLLDIPLSIK